MIRKTHKIYLTIVISAYILYFGYTSAVKFYTFGFYDFDLAAHALTMYNLLHGSLFNSILDISFLGNHVNLILFLLAPLYAIFQHPLTLLFIQTLLLGLGALPVYLLARKILSEEWGLVTAVAYLFYPALGFLNLFEFHPTALATFFLLSAIYYYEQERLLPFMIFSFLAMLCQENIPLAIVMFGALSFFRKRGLKWIFIPLISGTIYFLAALLIMRTLNKDTIQFITLYRWMGETPLAMFLNVAHYPLDFLRYFLRPESLLYIVRIFLPLIFIPLFGLAGLLPALPFFIQHMLSLRNLELSIYYHYAAEIIPFIFLSLIYGVRFLFRRKLVSNQRLLRVIVLSSVVFSNMYWGPVFQSPLIADKGDYLNAYRSDLLKKIPPEAAVVATFRFLPHLTNREHLYSFHHVYTGLHTLSNKPFSLPTNVEYALIDFNDPMTFGGFYKKSRYQNIQKFMRRGSWQVVDFLEGIVLFKNSSSGSIDILCQSLDNLDVAIANPLHRQIDNAIVFLGFDVNKSAKSDILDLTLYWQCIHKTDKVITIILEIRGENDQLILRREHPIGYEILPTNSWKSGNYYRERVRIKIPFSYKARNWRLKEYFADGLSGEPL